MSSRVLQKPISANKVLDLQIRQYQNHIFIKGTCPKLSEGGTVNALLKVSNIGDFLTQRMTGHYTTLVMEDENIVDDGTNHLSMKVTDTGNSIDIFDSHIPMDLVLTPGRTRKMGVTNAPAGLSVEASPQMFWPLPIEYIFSANTEIQFEIKNDSDADNDFAIMLQGIRIKSPISNKNI